VAAAGYATDPQYAEKIIAIIKAHNLGELDRGRD
jgi:flagellar protein FlgJ